MKFFDCLINNASLFENDKLENFNSKSWEKHISTNLKAPAILSKEFSKNVRGKKMKRKNKSGFIYIHTTALSARGGLSRRTLRSLYIERGFFYVFFCLHRRLYARGRLLLFSLFCCFGQFYMRRSLRVHDQRRSRGKDASSSSDDDDDEARGNWARSRFLVRLLPPG